MGESSSSPMTEARFRASPTFAYAEKKLICQILVVFPCISFADAVLHQSGQRRKDIDRRIDGLPVQRTVEHDLPLSDISGQVRDGVCDIIVWHGQDRSCVTDPFTPCTIPARS